MTNPIVVGLDGSDTSAVALSWAAAEAVRRDCPLEAITVTPHHGTPETRRHLVARAADQVSVVTASHPSLHIRHIQSSGTPERALIEASRRAAMLVVGSRGPRLVSRSLLGSVSAYCAAHSECPVLIVPDKDRATDFIGRSDADLVTTLGPLL